MLNTRLMALPFQPSPYESCNTKVYSQGLPQMVVKVAVAGSEVASPQMEVTDTSYSVTAARPVRVTVGSFVWTVVHSASAVAL